MILNESTANSNGIYSLKTGWLKVPVKDDIPDNVDLEPELSDWVRRASDMGSIKQIDKFMDDIYKLRQESILEDGEYGKGNLIFKELRNKGILQDLKDRKVELENKEMSLESNLYSDLMGSLLEIAELEDRPDLVEQIKKEMSSFDETLEEAEYNATLAKLKDKQDKVVEWYHRTMEKQSIPGEYDRNNPTLDEDLIARASNKFGFGSNKLRALLRGEDLWK